MKKQLKSINLIPKMSKRQKRTVSKKYALGLALTAALLGSYGHAVTNAEPASGTFSVTSSTATTATGSYTTPEGTAGTFNLVRNAATSYTSTATFTGGAKGIQAQNTGDVRTATTPSPYSGNDSFTYTFTITPPAGVLAANQVIEVVQAPYRNSTQDLIDNRAWNPGGGNNEPARLTLSNYVGDLRVTKNPTVGMHFTNGQSISGVVATNINGTTVNGTLKSTPQVRQYVSSQTPLRFDANASAASGGGSRPMSAAADHPVIAPGTLLGAAPKEVQIFAVPNVFSKYKLEILGTEDANNQVTLKYDANMLGNISSANHTKTASAKTYPYGETWNEWITFGVRGARADLQITKTTPSTTTDSNGGVSYTVTVTNAGPDPIKGAVLRDPAVSGLTINSIACAATPGTCTTATTPTVSALQASSGFALPVIKVGETYSIVLSGTMTGANGASVTNTATVTQPTGTTDPNTGNNTSSVIITKQNVPPIPEDKSSASIPNTAGATPLNPQLAATDADGTVATYTITSIPLASAGVLSKADGTPVTAGMTLTPAEVAGLQFDPVAGFVGEANFNYTATDNNGDVSTQHKDAAGNIIAGPATYRIPVTAVATQPTQLTVTKTDNNAEFGIGQDGTYTITVTNSDQSQATSGAINLRDVLPTGMSYKDVTTTTPGTFGNKPTVGDTGTLNWSFTPTTALSMNQSITFTMTVAVDANVADNTTLTNYVAVGGGGDPDALPTPGSTCTTNQCAQDSTLIKAAAPELTITKTDGNASFVRGDTGLYTLTVTNTGNAPTSGNITVRELLPTGLSFRTISSNNGTVSGGTLNQSGAHTFTVTPSIPLASGQNLVLNLRVNVDSNAATPLTNKASVGGGGTPAAPDPTTCTTTSGPCATDSTTTQASAGNADLSITKTTTTPTVSVGSEVRYELIVRSLGTVNTNNTVTIQDVVPSNLTNVTWTCRVKDTTATSDSYNSCGTPASGNGSGNNILITGAKVGQNDSYGDHLKIVVKGTATTAGTFVNTATVASGYNDTDENNNTSSATVTVIAPQPPLQCTTKLYAIQGNVTGSTFKNLVELNTSTGTISNTVYTFSKKGAALAINPDGKRTYMATYLKDPVGSTAGYGRLYWYDATSGQENSVDIPGYSWSSTSNEETERIVRMAIAPDGTGYMSSGTKLWTFTTAGTPVVTGPVNLSYTDSSGLAPVPSVVGNGDLITNNTGEVFLFMSPEPALSTDNYVDLFKIKADGQVIFYGRIKNTEFNGLSFGGAAALNNKIYLGSVNKDNNTGSLVNLDLGVLTASTVTSSGAATSDLTTCVYPPLAPNISHKKTVAKVAGSTGTDVKPGDILEYTIVVRNEGNLATAGSKFQDAIPAGSTYVAGTTTTNGAPTTDSTGGIMPYVTAKTISSPNAAQGIIKTDTTPGSVTSSPTDPDDNEVVIKFRVTVDAGATVISNQGVLTYVDGPTSGVPTDDPTTPAANDPTKTTVAPPPNEPDLTITKTHSGTWTQGDTGKTYTITVNNAGTVDHTGNVSVVDTLPTGLTATAISGTGWACTLSTCTRSDTLAAGASYPPITLTVDVASNAPASLTNSATVTGTGENNTSNNTATDPTTIAPGALNADLQVTKSNNGNNTNTDEVGDSLVTGSNSTYTVRVTNNGPSSVSGATLKDTVVSGLTLSSVVCSTATGNTCSTAPTVSALTGASGVTLPTLANGAFYELRVTASVSGAANSTAHNKVDVTLPSGYNDTTNNNNSANDSDNIVASGSVPTGIWSNSACLNFSSMPNLTAGNSWPSSGFASVNVTGTPIQIHYKVTSLSGSDTLAKYTPGGWSGDRWNHYFGAGQVSAITHSSFGGEGRYTVSAYATYGSGSSAPTIPITLMTGSAEDDGTTAEYVRSTTNGTPWAVVERAANTTNNNQHHLTTSGTPAGSTMQMSVYSAQGNFLLLGTTKNDATAASPLVLNNVIKGTGKTAQGFCVAYAFDRGDAPTSYNKANHLQILSFAPTLGNASQVLLANLQPATPSYTTTNTLASQPSAEPTERGTTATEDQDDAIPSISIPRNATSYTLNVPYNSTVSATVSGWIDFNGNGTFDAGEKATATVPAGSGNATLNWSGFDLSSTQTTTNTTYARFRIGSNATEAGNPTGSARDGEVEDYKVTIAAATPVLSIAKATNITQVVYNGSPVTPNPSNFVYTITVSNAAGGGAAQNVQVVDTLPTGLSYVSSTVGGTAATPNQSSGQPKTLTWNLNNLAAGATQSIAVTVSTPNASVLEANQPYSAWKNTATVNADNSALKTSNEVTTNSVYTKLVKAVHNVGATPSATIPASSPAWGTSGTGKPGEILEYCIDFMNYGSIAVENFVLSDTVPSNTTYVANSAVVKTGDKSSTPITAFPTATVTESGGVVKATIPTLAPNTPGSVCFRAKIK